MNTFQITASARSAELLNLGSNLYLANPVVFLVSVVIVAPAAI